MASDIFWRTRRVRTLPPAPGADGVSKRRAAQLERARTSSSRGPGRGRRRARRRGHGRAEDRAAESDERRRPRKKGGKDHYLFPPWLLAREDFREIALAGTDAPVIGALRCEGAARTEAHLMVISQWLKTHWERAGKLPPEKLTALCKTVSLQTFPEGEAVVTEGDVGLTFYIVFSGAVVVTKAGRGGQSAPMRRGAHFGELALSQKGISRRQATVTALEATDVIAVQRRDYLSILNSHHTAEQMALLKFLSEVPLLANVGWSRGRLVALSSHARRRTFQPEQLIVQQGATADNVYFILTGLVQVLKEIVVKEANRWPVGMNRWQERVRAQLVSHPFMTLGPGEAFGERAAVEGSTRTATCIALERTDCLVIPAATFRALLQAREERKGKGYRFKDRPDPVAHFHAQQREREKLERNHRGGDNNAARGRKIVKRRWVEVYKPKGQVAGENTEAIESNLVHVPAVPSASLPPLTTTADVAFEGEVTVHLPAIGPTTS